MKLKALVLSPEDRAGLEKIVEKGRDWRMRHRAQTLLHFADGWRAKAIATQQDLHLDTVYDRRKHWMEEGFDSLADKQRCGVASKVSEAQREQLRMWATAEPLTARQLVTKLKEQFDIGIHPNTLGVILKQMKFV
ncbi:MAG: helix-turn-helix domain-containing protein [Polaromonas sp.]